MATIKVPAISPARWRAVRRTMLVRTGIRIALRLPPFAFRDPPEPRTALPYLLGAM